MYAYALHERPIKREAKHSFHFILPVCCFLLTFLNSFCLLNVCFCRTAEPTRELEGGSGCREVVAGFAPPDLAEPSL